jgi:hypothetical protein
MTTFHSGPENLISDLKKLRASLIILTLIKLLYFIWVFGSGFLWTYKMHNIDSGDMVVWIFSFFASGFIIWILHCILMIIIIWYNWKKMPIDRKKKIDNTFMIMLLGIIGMWLWMPNKEEASKLITNDT